MNGGKIVGRQPIRNPTSGAVLVEGQISIGLFFITLFLIIEAAIAFRNAATAQYVLTREARNSIAYSRLVGIDPIIVENRIKSRASQLGVNPANWEIRICTAAAPNCANNTLGNGNDLLIFKVNPRLRMFAGTVPMSFVASVLITREPTV